MCDIPFLRVGHHIPHRESLFFEFEYDNEAATGNQIRILNVTLFQCDGELEGCFSTAKGCGAAGRVCMRFEKPRRRRRCALELGRFRQVLIARPKDLTLETLSL